jgi:hypothetical protein
MRNGSGGPWQKTGNGELAALAAKDMVFTLAGAVDTMQTVRLMEHQLRGKLFRKKYLTSVRGMACLVSGSRSVAAQPYLKVNVIRAPHVEAWKDGAESNCALLVRQLDAAQKCEFVRGVVLRGRSHSLRWSRRAKALRIEAERRRTPWSSGPLGILASESGVNAQRITMPNIDCRVGQRLARSRIKQHNAERKRQSWLVLRDIRPEEFTGHVVGALFLFRC